MHALTLPLPSGDTWTRADYEALPRPAPARRRPGGRPRPCRPARHRERHPRCESPNAARCAGGSGGAVGSRQVLHRRGSRASGGLRPCTRRRRSGITGGWRPTRPHRRSRSTPTSWTTPLASTSRPACTTTGSRPLCRSTSTSNSSKFASADTRSGRTTQETVCQRFPAACQILLCRSLPLVTWTRQGSSRRMCSSGSLGPPRQ